VWIVQFSSSLYPGRVLHARERDRERERENERESEREKERDRERERERKRERESERERMGISALIPLSLNPSFLFSADWFHHAWAQQGGQL
jgi:hypothetical protein